MTLLAPIFLLALPLIGIPIILHLWKKRRRETLPWGAMQFLINDDHRQRRLSNLDRWLVLIARCLTLLFLIGALARPLWHSKRYGILESKTDDILIIDQSLSTSRTDGDGKPLIDRMRQQAKDWVRSRPRGSSVRILTTAGRPQWLADGAYSADTFRPATLLKKLDELRPIKAQSNLSAAIRFAATTQFDRNEGEAEAQRRIWVLTDGQTTDWNLNSKQALDAFCAELKQAQGVELSVGFVPNDSKKSNLALTPLTSDGWRKAPGERLRVSTELVNHGTTGSAPGTVVWTVGNNELMRVPIPSMAPGATRVLEAGAIVTEPGTQIVRCSLEAGDAMAGDNEVSAIVETLDRVGVLVVSDRESSPGRLNEADFFAASLGKANDAVKKTRWRSVFEPEQTTSTRLQDHTLNDYDAVVLLDTATLPRDQMQRLTDYVSRGGGLWIFLGDHTEIESFNRDWYADGLGCSPVKLSELKVLSSVDRGDDAGGAAEEDPDSRLHPPERDHPTLQWLADSTQTDLGEVLVRRFYNVHRPAAQSQTRVLLRTSGGNPISLISSRGKGRVAVQTLPMNASWTNWPLTGSFVVMVDSWLRHLTEPRRAMHNLSPGSPLRLRIPMAGTSPQAEVESPGGEKSIALTVPVQDVRELRYSQTFESGVYQVRWEQRTSNARDRGDVIEFGKSEADTFTARRHFAVSLPPAESALASVPQVFRNRLARLPNVAVTQITDGPKAWIEATDIDTPGAEERRQVPKLPIWTPLLYSLLFFLLIELLLSSFASIRRFGRRRTKSGEDDVSLQPSLDALPPSLDTAVPSLDAAPPSLDAAPGSREVGIG